MTRPVWQASPASPKHLSDLTLSLRGFPFLHHAVRTGLHLPQTGGFGMWEEHDTPASFMANAFHAYRHRLCLGIPDPSLLFFDEANPEQRFSFSPLTKYDE